MKGGVLQHRLRHTEGCIVRFSLVVLISKNFATLHLASANIMSPLCSCSCAVFTKRNSVMWNMRPSSHSGSRTSTCHPNFYNSVREAKAVEIMHDVCEGLKRLYPGLPAYFAYVTERDPDGCWYSIHFVYGNQDNQPVE